MQNTNALVCYWIRTTRFHLNMKSGREKGRKEEGLPILHSPRDRTNSFAELTPNEQKRIF